MTYLDSTLKSGDVILLTKVLALKAMIFPVVMYKCESWTIREAARWIIDGFELWCWRKLLRIPWTARRPNQLMLKEINPWIFIRRIDVEAEDPKHWPPDMKSRLTGENADAGKDWWQKEKGAAEDEMVREHYPSSEYELERSNLGDTVHWVLKGRILKWFAIAFSSGSCFVRTLHHDPSILGGPTRHERWTPQVGMCPICYWRRVEK